MADILISKFTTQIPRVGATPATPGFAESEGQDPVNPSGSPLVYTPVTIGSPANGLSIDGSQVLTIGLASTSATGALSSTDWNTFNGKIGGSLTSGRIPFATGANTLSDDSALTWDNVNNIFSITGKANINFGTNNLLIGLNAGAVVSTGNSNTGIGVLSLNSLTTAVSNTGIGANALRSNISGNNNTAIGANSLLNATSGALVALGVNAGRFFTGNNNASGISNSIFIGNNSSAFSNTSSGEIVIGNFAVGLGNNTTVIGTATTVATVFPTGSLWIGTTSGTNTLDVNGTTRIRTISNLGTAATSVLVPSATGVVSLRTLAEFLSDAGGISGTIASGQVAFGTGVNTVGGSNNLFWDSVNGRLGVGTSTLNHRLTVGNASSQNTLRIVGNSTTDQAPILSILRIGNRESLLYQSNNTFFILNTSGVANYNDATLAALTGIALQTNGNVGIAINAPTNTLDVNGTARIRTISNLGTAATSVLVPSATGVVSSRTVAELRSDIGAIGGTIASGQVAFGTGVNTVGGDAGITWNNTDKILTVNTIQIGLGGGNMSTNTVVGFSALSANTTGATNTAMGVFALQNNITGTSNTAYGSASLRNINSGSQNTAIGANSGRQISSGANLTISNSSVFIGHDTRANADSETNQIVIGNSAIGGGSNTTTIGNTSTVSTRLPAGSLWVNTTSGTNTLDVNGTTRIRTIDNLGTAATSVLVPSATGVVSLRTLAELASDAGLVTITGTQTITGVKTFNTDFNIGNTALDYVSWDNTSKTFGIFSQVQFLHKYRGGASGALNIGQYDVNGNASINNTSNAALLFGTNNTTRIEIEADGDVLLKKVDNGAGNFVTIDASTGQLRKRTASEAASDLGVGQSFTTFTPTATASGGGGTYTLTDPTGQIYVNGDLVIIYVIFGISSSGSPSGNLEIGGITGGYNISGIIGGEVRIFSGSNVSATDLPLLYPNNVDSPLTKLKIRRKGAGTDVTGITFTSGTVELWYQFRKS